MQNAISNRQSCLYRFFRTGIMTLRHLYRLDVIISNLIALGICGIIAALLQTAWLLPHPTRLHHYFIIGLEILAALQVIKSSTKSLLLPTICLLIGSIGLCAHHFKFFEISIDVSYLQTLVMIGVIGACIAVLNIQ